MPFNSYFRTHRYLEHTLEIHTWLYITLGHSGMAPVCPRCNWSPATPSAWMESL